MLLINISLLETEKDGYYVLPEDTSDELIWETEDNKND